jgi:hypothetical protein
VTALAEAMDDPEEAALQALLDEMDPAEHMAAARTWRLDNDYIVSCVVCPCGYARFLASKDLAFAVARLHNRTGDEP